MFWFLYTFIIVICWLHCTYTIPHTHTHTLCSPLSPSLSQSVVTHALVVPATHTVCSLSLSLPMSLPAVGLAAREATTCGAANGGARTGSRGCTESGAAAAEEHQWGNYLHRYNVHAAALCGSQSSISIAAHEPQQQSHHNNNHNKGVNNNHSKTTATTTGAATTINLATFR